MVSRPSFPTPETEAENLVIGHHRSLREWPNIPLPGGHINFLIIHAYKVASQCFPVLHLRRGWE